jgi:hypothetical protein
VTEEARLKRISIDTMIVDKLLAEPGLIADIQAAGRAGRLEFVKNHIVRDQLGVTPDAQLQGRLLAAYEALPGSDVATRGVVLDASRLDMAGLGDASESGTPLGAVRTRGRGGMHDALIATTASGDADVLVTEDDELRVRVRAAAAKCTLWRFADLLAFVRSAEEGNR